MSTQEYEDMLYDSYARWCESVTISMREFQKAIANARINKWYLLEYAKCEAEFVLLTQRYEDSISTEDYQRCYNSCTFKMYSIKPSALLREIRKKWTNGLSKVPDMEKLSLTYNQN